MANHKGRNAAGKNQVLYGREKQEGPILTSIQCFFKETIIMIDNNDR